MRRVFDIAFSAIALVALSPVIVVVAAAVAVLSGPPVLYCAERVGANNRRFTMLKFRTMAAGSDRIGSAIVAVGDARVTRIGRVLRATKLDELPQLLNVLAGHMSVVGPRPEAPSLACAYTPEQQRVLSLKPGLTGPGTLYLHRSATATPSPDPERRYLEELLTPKIEIDLRYERCRSLRSDVRVVAQTAGFLAESIAAGTAGRRRATRTPSTVR